MIYRILAKLTLSLFLISSILFSVAYASTNRTPPPRFYAGGTIAYGKTTWKQLDSDDFAVQSSAPVSSIDKGTTWGAFLGYQFGKSFAMEATYMRYPNTHIRLGDFSFYYPLEEINTRTQVYSLVTKFLLPVMNARANLFMDTGVGFTRRSDVLAKVTRVGPTFGFGISFNPARRIITEAGFEYYVGYGKSERRPVADFVPFLYALYLRIGYRIC